MTSVRASKSPMRHAVSTALKDSETKRAIEMQPYRHDACVRRVREFDAVVAS